MIPVPLKLSDLDTLKRGDWLLVTSYSKYANALVEVLDIDYEDGMVRIRILTCPGKPEYLGKDTGLFFFRFSKIVDGNSIIQSKIRQLEERFNSRRNVK